MTLLYMAAGLFGLVLINVPIAVALGVVSVIAMLLSSGTATLPNMAMVLYDGATSFPLLAIPLFIFAGTPQGEKASMQGFEMLLYGTELLAFFFRVRPVLGCLDLLERAKR